MGQKILLADDSITIQKVIELTFTDEDFELHTVGNGQKAIEQIRTVKPDIVLCDIIMPEKSGYEVCEHIKTSEDLKHIPVLLLTGAFEPFDQERAKKAGCDGFLAKPFEPQTLISKVKELLKAPARPSGAAQRAGAPHAAPAGAPNKVATDTSAAVPPPQAPPPTPRAEEAGDATVMMSSGIAPPKAPTQPPSAPPSPPAATPPATPEGGGFEDLAVEAGERELSVDADDRTMFLGHPDESSDEGSDDIWGEVQGGSTTPTPPVPPSPPAPPESEGDEGKTIMMSSPVVPEPIESAKEDSPKDVPGGFTELPSAPTDSPEIVSGETTDDAWVIPGPDPTTESAEPELTPLGDFSGFDDFSADSANAANVSQPAQSTQPSEPVSPIQESAKHVDTTAEPWEEPVAPPAPRAPEPVSPPPSPTPSQASFAKPASSDNPPTSQRATQGSSAGFGGASSEPVSRPATGSTAQAGTASMRESDMEALADRVAKKVLSQLSEKVIQEIAWEVVPDLAESLIQKEIRKEIEELKAKIPR